MLLRKNIDLLPAKRVSAWRKVAIGTWNSIGDPSVYGFMDIPIEKALDFIERKSKQTGARITLTHFVGKAVGEIIRQNPSINCILRFGRLYPRKDIDIFFQVATDQSGHDLSGMLIRKIDQKSIQDVAEEANRTVKNIRTGTDQTYQKSKALIGRFPGFFARYFLSLSGFIMYTLNLWSPLLGAPRDPFGGAMITNIGSLGLETAFGPLVPYSRVPFLMVLGNHQDKPVVRDGQIVIAKMLRISVTFDHRLIDGMHGSKMVQLLNQIFEDPDGFFE